MAAPTSDRVPGAAAAAAAAVVWWWLGRPGTRRAWCSCCCCSSRRRILTTTTTRQQPQRQRRQLPGGSGPARAPFRMLWKRRLHPVAMPACSPLVPVGGWGYVCGLDGKRRDDLMNAALIVQRHSRRRPQPAFPTRNGTVSWVGDRQTIDAQVFFNERGLLDPNAKDLAWGAPIASSHRSSFHSLIVCSSLHA